MYSFVKPKENVKRTKNPSKRLCNRKKKGALYSTTLPEGRKICAGICYHIRSENARVERYLMAIGENFLLL